MPESGVQMGQAGFLGTLLFVVPPGSLPSVGQRSYRCGAPSTRQRADLHIARRCEKQARILAGGWIPFTAPPWALFLLIPRWK